MTNLSKKTENIQTVWAMGAPKISMSDNNHNSLCLSREGSKSKFNNNRSYNRDKAPDHWGHKLGKKPRNTTRICMVNKMERE